VETMRDPGGGDNGVERIRWGPYDELVSFH